jgi:phage-related protein
MNFGGVNSMANAFAILTVLAMLVEVCVDIIKVAIPVIRDWKSQLTSVVVGVLLATATATGLLSALQVNLAVRWIDYFLTGLIISRGSNFIHDLLSKLNLK